MMRTNKTKEKLAAGKTCFGITMRFTSDQVVEIAAASGCDFVIFDIEHEGFNLGDLVSMTRTADLAGMTPIARVGRGFENLIDPLLSAGIQGFSLARVRSVADFEALSDVIYYHPQGKRTYYPVSRAANYGLGVSDLDAWRAHANSQMLVHAIIEEKEALDNLDSLLSHPLLDVIECGRGDLRLSLGCPPVEEVARIEENVFAAAVAAGKYVFETVAGEKLNDRVWKEIRPGHGSMICGSASGILSSALSSMSSEVAAH
jgi:4-hydroxy-2-oxoheptanedioate aldolase